MKRRIDEGRRSPGWLARGIGGTYTAVLRGCALVLPIAITTFAICGTSHAQALLGSPGAGWQTWNLDIDPPPTSSST